MIKNIVLISLIVISYSGFGQTINQIGYYNVNGSMGIACKDNYMILSNGNIIDNKIPSLPALIGQYNVSGDEMNVLTSGDYAYFGTGMARELYIVDILDVTFPLHKSSIEFTIGNGIFGMDILENILFVALGRDGIICSIDVTDKSNPVILDTLYLSGGQCRDIVTKNNYAFCANTGGLKVIDITNVSNLQVISSIGSGYNSIDINENLAFLGKSSEGVDVFDISDPKNPIFSYSINTEGSGKIWDLKYKDNLLYLATNSRGLCLYEIDENEGIELASFKLEKGGQSFGVAVQDSLILLSDLIRGILILQYDSTGIPVVNPDTTETFVINHITTREQLNIFPNPAKDYVTVNSNNLIINEIGIFDKSGKLIKHINNKDIKGKINISDLKNGQYIIRVETNDKPIIKKLIKIE